MLNRPVVKLLAVCCAVLPALALAGASPKAQAHDTWEPTADWVRARNLEARGGEARLRALSTVQLLTETQEGDKVSVVRTVRSRPNRVRHEVQKDGKAMVKAFDGTQGWMAEGDAAPMVMDAQKSAKMAEAARFEDALMEPAARGVKLALAGVEDVKGSPAYKLELASASGTETRYIDQKSGLEVKRVTRGTYDGKEYVKTAYFSDYRRVDGVMVSHVTDWDAGQMKGRTVVKEVRYDAPVDEATFRAPLPRS